MLYRMEYTGYMDLWQIKHMLHLLLIDIDIVMQYYFKRLV